MEDDSESKFLRELAEIEDFKNRVDDLQTNVEELSDRIDKIEVLDIQKQINSLHDSLLETQRLVSGFRIDYEAQNFKTFLTQPQHRHLHTQLFTDAAATKSQITASNKPHELIVQFHDEWVKRLEKLNQKFISF